MTKPPRPNRIDPATFPDQPVLGSRALPETLDNLEHLLNEGGFEPRFNVIRKRLELRHVGGSPTAMAEIISFANLNKLGTGNLQRFVEEIGHRRTCNPVADWIRGTPWDGTDRLPALYGTVTTNEDYPDGLKETLLYRWLLSATAAALSGNGFKARGVLTLQGPQGIGKTSWIAALMPKGELRNECIKLDHHMDGASKDSIISAIAHWVVEIGELDGAFKRDVARLKGFLTNDFDKVRRPYGHVDSEYPRRTVFAATVNDLNFLVDKTGNSRWWTVAVERLDFQHGTDMQQVFAQLALDFDEGAQWWLTPEEEEKLEQYNQCHRTVSAIMEKVLDYLDLENSDPATGRQMTAIEVLRDMGMDRPSNAQCKECGGALRELLGPPKHIKGRDKWKIPGRLKTRPAIPPTTKKDVF